MNLISFQEFSDSEIRVTEDGRVSVFDVIKFCGKKNPRDTWNSLCEGYPEVVGKTDNYKFDGKGQRETPVADRKNILYIIGLLKGTIGKAYREDAANLFVAYSDASPELAGSIIDRATPENLKKIEARLKGKQIRVSFTSILQDHGVTEGWQFGSCTNAIYQPLLGGTAKEIREQRGLAKSANLRDNMDEVEIASVMLAEAVALKKIKTDNIQGFHGCRDASSDAATRLGEYLKG
jgi:hypothetical protein